MNWKIFSVEVFAIMAAYIMVMLPVAGATTVTVYSKGGYQQTTIPELVSRSVYKSGDTINVGISNLTEDTIQAVYVYKCRGLEPDACAGEAPDYHTVVNNSLELQISWDEAKDPTGQFANLMFIAKVLRPDGAAWQSFWHRVGVGGGSSSQDIDNVELYTDLYTPTQVVGFIQDRAMLPFGASFQVTRAVFLLATGLYELGSDTAMPEFVAEERAANEITDMAKTFFYVFPKNGGVKNAVTLYKNPSYTCGSGECESGLGETSSNCCYDCSCSSGYYCDGVGTDFESYTCKPEAAISLQVPAPDVVSIGNCYVSHTKEVTARVISPPASMQVVSSEYSLGGSPDRTAAVCEDIGGGYYKCSITIPADPNCGPGEQIPYLANNKLFFDITYNNGSQVRARTLTGNMPNVDLRSWVCGQYGCEEGAGETSAECCYDCPCPAGQYCDWASGQPPESGECKAKLTDNNINIVSAAPLRFSPHTPAGDTVSLVVQISPKPAGLSVGQGSCSLACLSDGIQCAASCQLSCAPIASADPAIHNMSCGLRFSIQAYEGARSYSLTPTISVPATYNDGAGTASETLSAGFASIAVSPSECGDEDCGGDEDYYNCCYDCPCPGGQYCDWVGTSGTCRDEAEIGLTAVVNQTKFDAPLDSYGTTGTLRTNVSARISNAPASMAFISAECDFNGSTEGCRVECEGNGVYQCEMKILPIDPVVSGFFNNQTKKITLSPARLRFTVTYNNGSVRTEKVLTADLPGITITPARNCGNAICDKGFGENADNCCMECSCQDSPSYGEGWICVPGNVPESQCVESADLVMATHVPDHTCLIMPPLPGKFCKFEPFTLDFDVRIVNAPADLVVDRATYFMDGNTSSLDCLRNDYENYSCSILFDPIVDNESAIEVGHEDKNISIHFETSYGGYPEPIKQNFTFNDSFKVYRNESEELESCQNEVSRIKSKWRDTKRDINNFKAWGWGMITLGTLLIICEIAGYCKGWAKYVGCFALGIGTSLLMYTVALKGVRDTLWALKESREVACISTDRSGLRDMASASAEKSAELTSAILTGVGVAGLCTGICEAIDAAGTSGAAGKTDAKTFMQEGAKKVAGGVYDFFKGIGKAIKGFFTKAPVK